MSIRGQPQAAVCVAQLFRWPVKKVASRPHGCIALAPCSYMRGGCGRLYLILSISFIRGLIIFNEDANPQVAPPSLLHEDVSV